MWPKVKCFSLFAELRYLVNGSQPLFSEPTPEMIGEDFMERKVF
jgi:hypothetical protein